MTVLTSRIKMSSEFRISDLMAERPTELSIADLITEIRAGYMMTGPWSVARRVFDIETTRKMHSAFHGSVDAAIYLRKTLTPDWRWWIADELYWVEYDKEAPCVTMYKGTMGVDLVVVNGFNDEHESRAFLIAILKAYQIDVRDKNL